MLEFAEYLITAAMICTLVGLLAGVALTASSRNRSVQGSRSRATVSVGGAAGPADMDGTTARPRGKAATAGKPSALAGWATGFEIAALVLLTAYIGIRMSITGHGPFSNQHEFAVAFAWGILLVNLFFELRYRIRMLSLAVLPVVAAMLVYALSLETGIKPLIPALQNNLLLTLHVGFAIVAYGAACVSFGAAVLYLLHPVLPKRLPLPRLDVLDDIGYRAAVVTFPLAHHHDRAGLGVGEHRLGTLLGMGSEGDRCPGHLAAVRRFPPRASGAQLAGPAGRVDADHRLHLRAVRLLRKPLLRRSALLCLGMRTRSAPR